MSLRFSGLLTVLIGWCSVGLLRGDEEQQKPDPGRFRTPLIRAWLPSTLVGDYQQFEETLQREMSAEVADDTQPEVDPVAPAEQTPQVKREGILIYYDPNPPKNKLTPYEFYNVPRRESFPGWPWLKPVRFVKIGSREDFLQELENRTAIETLLSEQTLEKQGDGFFLKEKEPDLNVRLTSYPEGHLLIPNLQPGNSLISYLNETSRYWTYRDGYMFFGDFEEILTMDFPGNRQLEPKGNDAEHDVFVRLDLDAVLPKQKRLLWEIIRKQSERSLQQTDDEDDLTYAFRKSLGDLQLNLIEAVTQNLESIRLGIDFASEEQPARAELELVARPGVNLERTFGKSGRGIPELAALIDEPSAMTFATSWGVPDRMVDPFEKFFRLFNAKLAEQQSWNVDALLASQELSLDLLDSVRDSNHVVLKLLQTEHGFTLFGGLRLHAADRVSNNLAAVLNGLTDVDGWGIQRSHDPFGRTYFSFRPSDFPKSLAGEQHERLPAQLHFTVIDSILWFSVGREDSLDLLAITLDRILGKRDQPARGSIPLALFDISLDRLFPDQSLEETQGFDRVPLAAVEKLDSLIPGNSNPTNAQRVKYANSISLDLTGQLLSVGDSARLGQGAQVNLKWRAVISDNSEAPDLKTNLEAEDLDATYAFYSAQLALAMDSDPMKLKKFLKPDQSHIRLRFEADEKRVRVRASVGLGVIRHVLSRMMQSGVTDIERYLFIQDNSISVQKAIRYLQTNPVQKSEP